MLTHEDIQKETEPTVVPLETGNDPIKLWHYGLILAVVIIWGVAFAGMKEVVNSATPFQAAGLRFFLGALPLLVVALQPKRRRKLSRQDYAKFALLGFLQTTLLFGINFTAIQHVPAGVSSILINTHPFFVAILAHLVLTGDRLTRQKLIGLFVGFGGVVFLVLTGRGLGEVAFYWPLILLSAGVVWATSSILIKKLEIKDALSLTAWQNMFGSLPLLFLGFVVDDKPINWNWPFVLWMLYLAFLASSFAWWAWSYVLQQYNASRITVFAFLIPVFGVVSGVVLLGETLTVSMLLGGSLVALGIVIVNKSRSPRPVRPSTEYNQYAAVTEP